MKVSMEGAMVGALVGAIGRAAVVMYWIGGVALMPILPSAGIGLLVGAIAGSLGSPLKGAATGFVLSAFVFELFMCSCASIINDVDGIFGHRNSGQKFMVEAMPYALLMGLAGAAAGAFGGMIGREEHKCDQPRTNGTVPTTPIDPQSPKESTEQ